MKENSSPFDGIDALKLSREQLAALPPRYPMFNICAGRHFHGFLYSELEPGPFAPHGGNITGLLWRYANEPNQWHLNYRFMYYFDRSGGYHPRDRRSWYYVPVKSGEGADHLLGELSEAIMSTLGRLGATAGKPTTWKIEGDERRFDELFHANPPDFLKIRAVVPNASPQ